jgi:hypothetical protein
MRGKSSTCRKQLPQLKRSKTAIEIQRASPIDKLSLPQFQSQQLKHLQVEVFST